MPGLRLITSNRLEILSRELTRDLSTPLRSPLSTEVIVVQSQGMERWLAQTLASTLGVWGNARYPFPNMILKEFFESVLPGRIQDPVFEPEAMTLRLMELFAAAGGVFSSREIDHYLGEAPDDLKRYQLARRIADTFDQYGVFRPELLLAWQEEGGGGWQGDLWRALVRGREGGHRAALRRDFFLRLEAGSIPLTGLPERISVFGISYLPPLHLEVLDALSRYIPISLFLMNPCREYWYDIASEREQVRRQGQGLKLSAREGQHWEVGNPLLASLGRQGRDFLGRVLELVEEEKDCSQEPETATLLHTLQKDILTLSHPAGAPLRQLEGNDGSLQVASCHGPMREVEVLYDQLLHLLESLPGLEPRDILVMTPDIEGYAPYISSVFGGVVDPHRKIPFSIADRCPRTESSLISAFLGVLGLPSSRFTGPQVLDILEVPAVHRRFGLTEEDLEVARRWISETRIRWGIDAEDRGRQGVPPFGENSWKSGLERLLLGYALPGGGRRMFEGILPFDDIEGSEAAVLGGVTAFVGELFAVVRSLSRPRSLAAWRDDLSTAAGRLFMEDDDTERDLHFLQDVFNELSRLQGVAGYGGAVDFRLVRSWVGERLENTTLQAGFLSGGVTFCAMQPMRSIPFRVIGMMGMNDGAFPRIGRPPGFDLIAAHPQRGDRCKRDEDRYLFLEALLSARDHLYISYSGQSVRDNSGSPPSVAVCELLDAIDQGFAAVGGGNPRDLVMTSHRLQGFSPAYFDGTTSLFSYSTENFTASRSRRGEEKVPHPLITAPLPPGDETQGTVSIPQFLRFFGNPSRYFLEERLGIVLSSPEASPRDREPFALDSLESYLLQQDLVSSALAGENLAERYPLTAASGILPPGEPGAVLYRRLCQGAEAFADRVREFLPAPAPSSSTIDLELAGVRLVGRLDGGGGGLVRYRYAAVKPKDRLRIWLEHLILAAAAGGKESLLIGSDRICRYRPPENPRELLTLLLQRYREGGCRPLPLFVQASFRYAEAMNRGAPESQALAEACGAWQGGAYHRGEGEDAHHRLCHAHGEPLAPPFASLALEIFAPLLEHQEEG